MGASYVKVDGAVIADPQPVTPLPSDADNSVKVAESLALPSELAPMLVVDCEATWKLGLKTLMSIGGPGAGPTAWDAQVDPVATILAVRFPAAS